MSRVVLKCYVIVRKPTASAAACGQCFWPSAVLHRSGHAVRFRFGGTCNKSLGSRTNIRNQDLLPRVPQGVGQNGQNIAASAKPQIYTGEEVSPIEGAQPQPQPTANGQGYDLNFENAPIASVAKTVLGDILKVGYTVDPRVQGTISLASGRPVPKSDLLFVFETALRLTGVAIGEGYCGLSPHSRQRCRCWR